MPCIEPTRSAPESFITFTDAMGRHHQPKPGEWVCFYEHDEKFLPFIRDPLKYLDRLREFDGVVSPDLSTYRDYPEVMKEFNCYLNFLFGAWMQSQGLDVIANVRLFGYRGMYAAIEGAPRGGTIAISALGSLKNNLGRRLWEEELEFTINRLHPDLIVVYGRLGPSQAELLRSLGVKSKVLPSKIDLVHKRVGEGCFEQR
jgi:hypothetical protein